MQTWRRAALLLMMGLAGAGCVRNTGADVRASGGSEILRADEIRRSGATDILSAIRMLRPAFLQTRGRTSILRSEEAEPTVYVDERLFGSLATLGDIPANTVIEVRHFNAAQAQMRWGAGNSQGAILVITGSPK